ncbi:DUF5677 domain-containing protein [Microtetraspora malaysiensis]|uniref:DUF5677 domain-containing protein n=1 Tax=Microtetraspora malaysiensis TaxID=161358 RepID=UPI003D90908D
MSAEISEFLRVLTDIANQRIENKLRAEDEIDRGELILDAWFEYLRDPKSFAPARYARSTRQARRQNQKRAEARLHTQKSILKRFYGAFHSWELALASSELINHQLAKTFWARMADPRGPERTSSLLGISEEFGGPALRLLLLTGMQARMITISEEVLLLLRNGFHDGAYGRMRTLYELVIKAFFICNNEPTPGSFELAERYYVTGRMETGVTTLDAVDNDILREARLRWGEDFFRGENNWAAPGIGIPQRRRITFRDIEEAVEASFLRELYIECNAAVHAGARKIIEEFNPRLRNSYPTRGRLNKAANACIGLACAGFLKMGTMEILKRVAIDTEQYDLLLEATAFIEQIDDSIELFNQISREVGNIPLLPIDFHEQSSDSTTNEP